MKVELYQYKHMGDGTVVICFVKLIDINGNVSELYRDDFPKATILVFSQTIEDAELGVCREIRVSDKKVTLIGDPNESMVCSLEYDEQAISKSKLSSIYLG